MTLVDLLRNVHVESGAEVTHEFEQLVAGGLEPRIEGKTSLGDLRENGFLPELKIKFGVTSYYVSKFFDLKDKEDKSKAKGLPGFVYYVIRDNPEGQPEILVRTGYFDISANEFRVIAKATRKKRINLPGSSEASEARDMWYDNEFRELQTSLPFEIADSMQAVYPRKAELPRADKELFLAIPALEERSPTNLKFFGGTMAETVGDEKILMKKGIAPDPEQRKLGGLLDFPPEIGWFTSDDPGSFVFADGFKPDLDKLVKVSENNNPLYGKVETYFFLSENQKAWYSFHIDSSGRGWIGDAQITTPDVTNYGAKNILINFGELSGKQISHTIRMGLFTSAYEFSEHVFSRFSQRTETSMNYADATKFTHSLPIVADFLKKYEEGSLSLMEKGAAPIPTVFDTMRVSQEEGASPNTIRRLTVDEVESLCARHAVDGLKAFELYNPYTLALKFIEHLEGEEYQIGPESRDSLIGVIYVHGKINDPDAVTRLANGVVDGIYALLQSPAPEPAAPPTEPVEVKPGGSWLFDEEFDQSQAPQEPAVDTFQKAFDLCFEGNMAYNMKNYQGAVEKAQAALGVNPEYQPAKELLTKAQDELKK